MEEPSYEGSFLLHRKKKEYNMQTDCGCIVKCKKDIHRCSKCGKTLCSKHIYFYVDESNRAITNNSKGFCLECYKAKYR